MQQLVSQFGSSVRMGGERIVICQLLILRQHQRKCILDQYIRGSCKGNLSSHIVSNEIGLKDKYDIVTCSKIIQYIKTNKAALGHWSEDMNFRVKLNQICIYLLCTFTWLQSLLHHYKTATHTMNYLVLSANCLPAREVTI